MGLWASRSKPEPATVTEILRQNGEELEPRVHLASPVGYNLIVLPVGEYDSIRAINLGTNRWSLKPELGLSVPVGQRWLLDTYLGTWFFTDNEDFVFGVREQELLLTTQVHVSYNLSLLSWAAFDWTFYSGGRVVVDGTQAFERQNNTPGRDAVGPGHPTAVSQVRVLGGGLGTVRPGLHHFQRRVELRLD